MLPSATNQSRRVALHTTAAFILVLAFASAIHPYGKLKAQRGGTPDVHAAIADERVAGIVARSCANCHSDHTSWPWYSYLPPASWLVEKDVAEGRSHLNLSTWASYGREKKAEILADIARSVANREMPLHPYLLLHKEARLSDEDAQVIISWASHERRTLRKTLMDPAQQTPAKGRR